MRRLVVDSTAGPVRTVLALGAHSDDLEIGAGGTLRQLLKAAPNVIVHWVVFAARGKREQEARDSARGILGNTEQHKIEIHDFRDGFFPYDGDRLKTAFELLKSRCEPDVVFTHHKDDLHQDHRIVGELTWNTFRNHLILEYEIPKYDGGLRSPNFFVPMTESQVREKTADLMTYFGSQRSKSWFTEDTFRGLMRLRGIESQSDFAEAFYCRKMVLDFPAG